MTEWEALRNQGPAVTRRETSPQAVTRLYKERQKERARVKTGLGPFFDATSALLRALAACDDLPEPVMEAADQLRRAVVALGAADIGPPP